MNNYFFLIIIFFFSCKNKIEYKTKSHNQIISTKVDLKSDIIKKINDTLKNKINIEKFLDSIVEPENIKIISKLNESYLDNEKINILSSDKYNFKLKTESFSDKSNSIFIDGNHKVNFKNLEVLKFNTNDFKSEDFGFNFENNLNNVTIIEISGKKFLYSDLSFNCNGIGCGCQLNFIYDISKKKAFIIDNYRFPYFKFFLSDFNNDKVLDLIVISRNTKEFLLEKNIEKISYLLTWFKYENGAFSIKSIKGKNSSIIISMFTDDFHHQGNQTDYFIEQINWN